MCLCSHSSCRFGDIELHYSFDINLNHSQRIHTEWTPRSITDYVQLILTFMLTSIVVYLYTVLAFNFFRKFYVQEEEGEEPDSKCHDMLSVRPRPVQGRY